MEFASAASIDADPADVWAVLADAAAWPDWDSGVTEVRGRLAPGEKVTISVAANPGRAFPVTVAEADAPRRLRLVGGMPLGLFRGERTYTLAPRPGGGTDFAMREEYTGPLRGLIGRSIPDLSPSFAQFANGLKAESERRAGPPAG